MKHTLKRRKSLLCFLYREQILPSSLSVDTITITCTSDELLDIGAEYFEWRQKYFNTYDANYQASILEEAAKWLHDNKISIV